MTKASIAQAESTAKSLLSNADLPLVFRVRASMILGLSIMPGYVEWARQAVHYAQLARSIVKTPGKGAAEAKLLEKAQEVLRWAEQDYEECGGYGAEEDEEEVEEGEEGGPAEEEVGKEQALNEVQPVEQDVDLPPDLSAEDRKAV